VKIDKAVFAASTEFSVCWNLVSKLYRVKLGIEPVCLLFGQNPGLSTEYGSVIEMPVKPQWPALVQITWSKFYHVLSEPETTWMVGDIDLMPLQQDWFVKKLEAVPDDHYVHLDADGITQLSGTPYTWTGRGELHQGNMPTTVQHETNLPGHYHVGKGATFQRLRTASTTFDDEVQHIVSHHYGSTRSFRASDPIEQCNLWCAEEKRSTELVREAIRQNRIRFTGFSMRHGIGQSNGDRIDRSTLRDESDGIEDTDAWRAEHSVKDYAYDLGRLQRGEYVDLHCARPFTFFMPQTLNVLAQAGIL